MTAAICILALFIVVYVTMMDIFTVLFRLTGLTEEKARFQVVSLLTNSGYTTRESEIIANTPKRRKLAKITMIFGYVFAVAIVSVAVNLFLAMKDTQLHNIAQMMIYVFLGFLLFYFIRRNRFLKKHFDVFFEKIGNRVMFGKKSNPIVILDTYGDLLVAEIMLNRVPLVLQSVPLSKSGIKESFDILIMMVKKEDEQAQTAQADTVLENGDIIVVLGAYKKIWELFEKVVEKENI